MRGHDALRGDETLEGREPMVIVARAVIGLAALARCGEFSPQRCRPFAPSKEARFRQSHGERESMGLPRLGEDRAAFVARQ
jgi:hypothetical protein